MASSQNPNSKNFLQNTQKKNKALVTLDSIDEAK